MNLTGWLVAAGFFLSFESCREWSMVAYEASSGLLQANDDVARRLAPYNKGESGACIHVQEYRRTVSRFVMTRDERDL